jgi:hypothetical protein
LQRYKVIIAPPKTKKTITKLIVTLYNGEEITKEEYDLTDFGDIDFEVPDDYEWRYSSSVMFGQGCRKITSFFDVTVEYHGSKKQVIMLVPERI